MRKMGPLPLSFQDLGDTLLWFHSGGANQLLVLGVTALDMVRHPGVGYLGQRLE